MNGCALLVIDVQAGAFDGQVIPAVHAADDLLERVAGLIRAARSAEVPVFYIQHCAAEGELLIEGTQAWAIHPSVSPEPSDLVVLKRESSAFDGTNLRELLDRHGIDTVMTCGIQSEHCVANTSVAALESGLRVYVARDAHSTLATEEAEASVIIDRQNSMLAERGARVQSSAALMELLADSGSAHGHG